MNPYLYVSEEVRAAIADNRPVVALESTIISHDITHILLPCFGSGPGIGRLLAVPLGCWWRCRAPARPPSPSSPCNPPAMVSLEIKDKIFCPFIHHSVFT